MDKTKLYSPLQASVGSLFGGPLATIYVLKKNFDALGNTIGSKRASMAGMGVLVLLPFLLFNFVGIICALIAYFVAQKKQMTKQAILQSDRYEFQSNWNILGVVLGSIIVSVGIVMLWLMILGALHVDLSGILNTSP